MRDVRTGAVFRARSQYMSRMPRRDLLDGKRDIRVHGMPSRTVCQDDGVCVLCLRARPVLSGARRELCRVRTRDLFDGRRVGVHGVFPWPALVGRREWMHGVPVRRVLPGESGQLQRVRRRDVLG